MRRLVPALAVLALLAPLGSPLAAQSGTSRNRNPRPAAVTVSAGLANSTGDLGSRVTHTDRGPLVGGSGAGPHLALGAAFPIAGTALEVRAEAFYNQLAGPRNTMLGTEFGATARMATRDRAFGAGTVLLWRVRPEQRAGPYLMTGAGLYHTRLTSAPMFDDPRPLQVSGTGFGLSLGAGFEAPLFGRRYFVEARRHLAATESAQGAAFLPITIGTRF